MGAWGVLAFDNDEACDWASGLNRVKDLSLVSRAFATVGNSDNERIRAHDACDALAACEVLARLKGNPGYKNPYTEDVDVWVAAHSVSPPAPLLARADAVIDRILGENSELAELWDEGDGTEWRAAVDDLRRRLRE
jgi:hypothetical protein